MPICALRRRSTRYSSRKVEGHLTSTTVGDTYRQLYGRLVPKGNEQRPICLGGRHIELSTDGPSALQVSADAPSYCRCKNLGNQQSEDAYGQIGAERN